MIGMPRYTVGKLLLCEVLSHLSFPLLDFAAEKLREVEIFLIVQPETADGKTRENDEL
jgi:hypothetical protein